jgi:hypothetical protein
MPQYAYEQARTYKIDDEGERLQLANFTARITRETRLVDGLQTETTLTLEGELSGPGGDGPAQKLPPVDIAASSFAGMQWVMQAWGTRAIIFPGSAVKEDLRTAIQLNSQPTVHTIYRSIGWTEVNKQRAYLHAGGAITKKGNDKKVTVRLPVELSKYNLATQATPRDGFMASLALTELAPASVAWSLWCATYAPLFGAVDFATHLTGRSGTFKSELISLFQSHYGPEMDARHLPGSWSSTANALEAQSYFAANAPFTIDDFVPVGTSWQVRAYQTNADKIVRAQGNQSGRARLTDTSSLQSAYYPRGIIMSTGEDTPEGHSVRARMMILEMSPGDIKPLKLSEAQSKRKLYVAAIVGLIQELCARPIDLTERSEQIRNMNIDIGHTRTPPMIGRLIATGEAVLDWAHRMEWLTDQQHKKLVNTMTVSILQAGNNQHAYLETADPVEIFKASVKQVLGANMAHLRKLNGGIPARPTMLGWTEEGERNDVPAYKSHGPCIGWIDWQENEMYLDINTGYNIIRKVAGQELTLTKQTLFKRMKDAGILKRTDEARQRNTIRVTCENHPRTVICLAATDTLEDNEIPNEDIEENDGPLPSDDQPFNL